MSPATVHLRAGGVSVVVDARGTGVPSILHWGADLGPLEDAALTALADALTPATPVGGFDDGVPLTLLPTASEGWLGTPGLAGSSSVADGGAAASPAFLLTDLAAEPLPDGGHRLVCTSHDAAAHLRLRTTLELDVHGVLRLRHDLTRTDEAPGDYALASLLVLLPLAAGATELLDLTGRWARERSPQRHELTQGTWRREARHGRTGHDATLLLVAGTPGFGFRRGEVRGVHVAWSGRHVTLVEHQPTGARTLGGGELLDPGEVVLAPGDTYTTPWLVASWSDVGLDGMSRRLHEHLRARPAHPRTPRPVTLNTWEAVYFDHDLDRLRALADAAADLGVERFVLDDGWFGARRDDTAGLGDWTPSPDVWPTGLAPIVEHVTGLGMQFGLWVEPEMVNLDSDLARAHPEWVLGPRDRRPRQWRHQQVLDLTHPGAFAHVLAALDDLLSRYAISALKWDHNRDLSEAMHEGRPAVHQQTLAVYRLLDELRARHPHVEIESCASGGGRIDLGILERTDRVWASDCNDALERQAIQLWTSLLLPPELVGTHIGAPLSHTTGRTHQLDFRAVTALFGHAGLEWDISSLDDGTRAQLRSWVSLHRELRELLHTGHVVHADLPDDHALLHGVVARDGSEAVYAWAVLRTGSDAVPPPVPLPGLDPDRLYAVEVEQRAGGAWAAQVRPPAWTTSAALMSGAALAAVGLPMPLAMPEHAVLLRARAQDDGTGARESS